jgi:uncharacterized protein DUF4082/Calx-beta domain-containing protein/Big-like domain-containing protein/purple acid phosphatase-like protein
VSAIASPAGGATVGSGDRVTITGTASDSGGIVAGVEVSVDGGTTWRAATGTANWSYEWTPDAGGQVTIRTRATDDSGNIELPAAGIAVVVNGGSCPCSTLFSGASAPAIPDVDDPGPVELGLKFKSDVNGFVKGVRFYKSVNNTGTHVGNLWATTGGPALASATFTGESASGWQEAVFDTPVAITVNTTYVVSYHTNVGHYAATGAYFATAGIDRSPLHAPPTAAAGGNGVYGYGASALPTNTFNATNYWVDVVFDSTPDTTAPAIGDVRATPIDGATALVTWTTDEPATSSVDYSTDATFFAPATQTVTDAAFVTAHGVRLTGLRPSTAYSFRVRSTDRAGNTGQKPSGGPTPPPAPGQLPPAPQIFTMPSPTLHDMTSADFGAGVGTRTYVAETGDGELTLAPARGSEFSGSTVPPGWTTRIWSDGGSAIVGGGKLIVDGARVASCVDVSGTCQESFDLVPGTAVEFVATFTGDPYQHSGLGQTLEVPLEPMAIFSTTWTDASGAEHAGSALGVRTYNGSDAIGETRSTLGPGLLNAPHKYRIDWLPAQVVYSVDGVEVARHNVSIGAPMRPVAASDFNAFSGKVVVDWVRNTPYVSSGSFLSRVFDGSIGINWEHITWAAETPAGTSIAIAVRAGNTAMPDETWTPFASVAAPGAVTMQARYIQYRADLSSNNVNQTPALSDVRISGAAPPAPSPVITPAIVWPAPGAIVYGTALGATQLNAATSPAVAGTYAYDPPAGTALPAGDRTLSVRFTPTDTTRYTSADASVSIKVMKAPSTISWSTPAAIAYGTALGVMQLNATANIAGTFAYSPAAGVVLGPGAAQPLAVTFTPSDTANYNGATATVAISVVKRTGIVTVTSSNSPSLIGAPIVLTATVVPASATGSVTFRDGLTAIGSAAVGGGAATMTTASLTVGTHSIIADYSGDGAVDGATSVPMSQVINPSGKIVVRFAVHSLQDTTKRPKVQTIAVPNALVKVFATSNACAGNIFKTLNPKKWGQIFDGADGVGGDEGCPVISVGSYQAIGTTNAAGSATIVVPPLDFSLQNQYLVIARATNFDYVKTASSMDPLYSAYPILMVAANTTRNAPLSLLATFNGKIVPGAQVEFFGSYLNIIQPEYVDWTEDEEQYPFVMVAQGGWDLTTSVTPPAGLVADEPALSASVADTTSAIQFTMTDIGSEWTDTAVSHSIVHNGAATATKTKIPMIDRKKTLARDDRRKVMHDSAPTLLDVTINDKVNHLRKPLRITATTPALNGALVVTDDLLNVSYTPMPGYSGDDTFTYTVTDTAGVSSTATVSITVLPTPDVMIRNGTALEGNDGTTPVTVNVVLTSQSLDPVTVTYRTADGTALAGADYEAASGSLTFAPQVTSMPLTVNVLGDTGTESNERFSVKVTSADRATIPATADGNITIVDDDPPAISIAATASQKEGDTGSTNLAVVVTLSQPYTESVFVDYATADGTARAGSDYLPAIGTLQLLPGEVTKTIYVPIVGDTVGEPTESFYVDLSGAQNATLGRARAAASIVNDDSSTRVLTTAADFASGTFAAGAYLSETGDGELMLAPAQASEFSGSSLPAGWVLAPMAAGASAGVANGMLAIDGGAFLAPSMITAGQTLEMVATFSGAINQSIGFGTTGAQSSPMAMFVIKSDRQLYARTINGAKVTESMMAGIDWLKKAHRYQITWNAGNAQYFIDGTLMISHTNMAWGTVAMRPVLADAAAGDGALAVDYVRLTPYASSGSYTSAVVDAGESVTWQKVTTTGSVPNGTASTISCRTGSTPVPDDTWTPFAPLGAPSALGSSRYLQFAIQLTTAGAKTPIVQDVTVQFKQQ